MNHIPLCFNDNKTARTLWSLTKILFINVRILLITYCLLDYSLRFSDAPFVLSFRFRHKGDSQTLTFSQHQGSKLPVGWPEFSYYNSETKIIFNDSLFLYLESKGSVFGNQMKTEEQHSDPSEATGSFHVAGKVITSLENRTSPAFLFPSCLFLPFRDQTICWTTDRLQQITVDLKQEPKHNAVRLIQSSLSHTHTKVAQF